MTSDLHGPKTLMTIYSFALLALGWTSTASSQYGNCTSMLSKMGDGFCDPSLNNLDCGYDEGDCCKCSCIDGPNYQCGSNEYTCRDPACLDPDIDSEFPNCTGNILLMNDGECDFGNNNAECGYDGGDCCLCTCVSNGECSFSGFDCKDPSAEAHLYECQPRPQSPPPCASDVQRNWVVDNSTQAWALSEAVNCSGGYFNVEWIGPVTVEKTIYISDGTVLNIWGLSSSVIDGNLAVRLFTVVDASLHLTGVGLNSGYSIIGGAITASASNVSLTRTSFSGNKASGDGGAVCVISNSNLLIDGNITTLVNNSAMGFGGAIFVGSGSALRFSGEEAHFFLNAASDSGGAIAVGQSQLFWNGKAFFANNTADSFGGAVDVATDSFASWAGSIDFSRNSAGLYGGALVVRYDSIATWSANALFERNSAGDSGGAIETEDNSSVFWTGSTLFLHNSAKVTGGGAIRTSDAEVSWSGVTCFQNNSAKMGGAMFVLSDSRVWWNGPNTTFTANTATVSSGGAIIVVGSNLSWSGATVFCDNGARELGGSILMWNGTRVNWSGDTTFARNRATSGGAIYIYRDVWVEWTGPTIFASNEAEVDGGAVGSTVLDASADGDLMSSLSIAGVTAFEGNACEGDGGAMVLVGGLSAVFYHSASVTFRWNTAGVSGGAVFISGADVGTRFNGVSFISNSAELGGGVYSTSSGNSKFDLDGEETFNPTTFENCSFVGNTATATGGAIQSAAGQDWIQDSSFVGNTARVGGALYLAGTASIVNCSFVDNVADEGAGPAILNIGNVDRIGNSSFVGNAYNCAQGTYRAYNAVKSASVVTIGVTHKII